MTFLNEIEQKHELYIADSPCDEKHEIFTEEIEKKNKKNIV